MAGGAYGEAAVPRGRHGLGPDAVSAQQRERLFAATVELIARQGYRHTSIDQIVKTAQVGYRAFYDLFEGKEDCFLAAFDRVAAETAEAMAGAVAAADEWREQIAAALACLLDSVAGQPRLARLALIEAHAAGPRARARYEQALGRAAAKLREGRSLDPAAPQLSPLLEDALVGGIAWTIRQRLLEADAPPADQLLDRVVEIALAPYVSV
jgi:AcrR family transcriptional regulator